MEDGFGEMFSSFVKTGVANTNQKKKCDNVNTEVVNTCLLTVLREVGGLHRF